MSTELAPLVDLRPTDWAQRIPVGSDIAILLWADGRIGFEHICRGVWQEPGEPRRYLIAPFWPGQLIQRDPLTLSPSLLCHGSALPCGLHGFVTDGRWRPA